MRTRRARCAASPRAAQTFIRGQFAEKREKDSARALVKSARESTSIAWSADKKGAKAFYGEVCRTMVMVVTRMI